MENEFRRHYKENVMPALQKRHGYKNVHQIPKVEKVVINTSVGSHADVKQALEEAKAELALITGQRPVERLAKKSISNFKLRNGRTRTSRSSSRSRRKPLMTSSICRVSFTAKRTVRSPFGFATATTGGVPPSWVCRMSGSCIGCST